MVPSMNTRLVEHLVDILYAEILPDCIMMLIGVAGQRTEEVTPMDHSQRRTPS